MVPLLVRSLGGALGEPAAEDFDMLRRALLEGSRSFLDGGGSNTFWRPVAFQGYLDLLGSLIVRHPRVVASIHVALHEASRRRMWSALPALALALLSKEAAAVTAVLLPFMPGVGAGERRSRVRWLIGSGAVLVAWAWAYSAVRSHAGLELPHGLERDLQPARGTRAVGLVRIPDRAGAARPFGLELHARCGGA